MQKNRIKIYKTIVSEVYFERGIDDGRKTG